MKILVCVKRVPDTAAKIRINSDEKSIEESGVEFIVNPYDDYALEEAIRLKEKLGTGEVVAVSVGSTQCQDILRKCLAIGADRAILVKDEGKWLDAFYVASKIAEVAKTEKADVIFFGKQAVDDDLCLVGSMTATLLDIGYVNVVVKIEYEKDSIKAHREIEGAHEIVSLKLPCVISCQKGLNEPRYATIKGIMAAKKKTIEEREVKIDVINSVELIKLEYPPEREQGKIVGNGVEAVPELIRLLHEEAKVI